jgi:hypothetical protein
MLNALKMSQFHDLQQEVARIVQELCEYFNINLDIKMPVISQRATFAQLPNSIYPQETQEQ